jgi:hypothetical protein
MGDNLSLEPRVHIFVIVKRILVSKMLTLITDKLTLVTMAVALVKREVTLVTTRVLTFVPRKVTLITVIFPNSIWSHSSQPYTLCIRSEKKFIKMIRNTNDREVI